MLRYLASAGFLCRWLLLGLLVNNAVAGVPEVQDSGLAAPPARQIPGLTAVDQFPQGCVGCHVNLPAQGLDARLSTVLQHLSQQVPPALLAKAQAAVTSNTPLAGRHPLVPQALNDVPHACILCHQALAGRAPVFSRMVHLIHLTGDGNHFLSHFQGECSHCHKLDRTTGIWSVPSNPEQ